MKIDFIECEIPITKENTRHFEQFGDLLLLRVKYINQDRCDYAVLQYHTTASGGKIAIFDGNFFYEFENAGVVTGYITLEV